jgi:DNA-binding MarR family transcriptional regulator
MPLKLREKTASVLMRAEPLSVRRGLQEDLAAQCRILEERVRELSGENAILKSAETFILRTKTAEALYDFMRENKGLYSVQRMAEIFGISRQAYYQWEERKREAPEKEREKAEAAADKEAKLKERGKEVRDELRKAELGSGGFKGLNGERLEEAVLREIERAGREGEELRQREIAEAAGISAAKANGVIKVLEVKGLIEVIRENSRKVRYEVSRAGRKELDERKREEAERLAGYLKGLQPEMGT